MSIFSLERKCEERKIRLSLQNFLHTIKRNWFFIDLFHYLTYLGFNLFKAKKQISVIDPSAFPRRSSIFPLRQKFPYSEFFGSAFFRIRTECGQILRISPYSVRMVANMAQKFSQHGHFSRTVQFEESKISALQNLLFDFFFQKKM